MPGCQVPGALVPGCDGQVIPGKARRQGNVAEVLVTVYHTSHARKASVVRAKAELKTQSGRWVVSLFSIRL